jgi:hypothetical protein
MILSLSLAYLQAALQGSTLSDHFGLRLVSIGDLDGDGFPDFLVGDVSRGEDDNGPGTVWVFSGNSGEVLGTLRGREAGQGLPARFGFSLATLEDIDHDGVPDFVVGACGDSERKKDDHPSPRQGYARIYSGKDLRVLHEFDGDTTDDGFGCAVASAGDIDGDQISDVVVGAPGCSRARLARRAGYIRIFSGRDGTVLRTHPKLWTSCIRFGFSVASLGDLDRDAVPDLAVGIPKAAGTGDGTGRVEVFSGKTGILLFAVEAAESSRRNMEFGRAIAALDDWNTDGVPDFLVSRIDVSVRICSGKDGSTLQVIDDPGRYGYLRGFGESLANLGDVNGDGRSDFAVGCEEQLDSGDSYDVRVFSGSDGSELRVLARGHEFVVVAAAGDVNADLVPDLLVGRWQSDVVDVISGRTWETIRSIRRPRDTR